MERYLRSTLGTDNISRQKSIPITIRRLPVLVSGPLSNGNFRVTGPRKYLFHREFRTAPWSARIHACNPIARISRTMDVFTPWYPPLADLRIQSPAVARKFTPGSFLLPVFNRIPSRIRSFLTRNIECKFHNVPLTGIVAFACNTTDRRSRTTKELPVIRGRVRRRIIDFGFSSEGASSGSFLRNFARNILVRENTGNSESCPTCYAARTPRSAGANETVQIASRIASLSSPSRVAAASRTTFEQSFSEDLGDRNADRSAISDNHFLFLRPAREGGILPSS